MQNTTDLRSAKALKLLLQAFLILTAVSGCGNRWSDAFLVYRSNGQDLAKSTPVATATPRSVVSVRPSARPETIQSTGASPLPEAATVSSYLSNAGKSAEIRLYRSYGSSSQVLIRGRVMEPEKTAAVNADDSTLTNVIRNVDNLSVDEIPGLKVDLTLQGKTVRLVSDHEGMLLVETSLFGALQPGWHTLQAQIVPGQKYWSPIAKTQIILHDEQIQSLGFVSDIDDTIKVSDVTNKLQALKRLLSKNSKTAEMIPGTATLYQILEQHDHQADGDFHYLSGSPLNMASSIYDFLDSNGFPKGSVDLKKWGFDKGDDNPIQQQDYKQNKLRTLFKTYPQRVFILFGDSGEKDPEIYRQIASEFPGRVKGIFINHVTDDPPTATRYQGIYLTQNTAEAASFLQSAGLISVEELNQVKQNS